MKAFPKYSSVSTINVHFEKSICEAFGHKTELRNVKVVTCTEDGYTGDKICLVCGQIVEKGKTISAKDHKSVTKNAKAATYFDKGYTGDRVCTVCGKTISKGSAIAQLKLATPKMALTAGKKLFKVKYTKVTGATGFQLRYRISGKWIVKNFDTKKTATKTIKKLTTGKNYSVQIRAFIKSGKQTAYSDWTKTKIVKIK